MFDQFLSKANELLGEGKPFAVAVVVRYQAPISGKPGDRAIIQSDGTLWGWIGGGCAQPVVIREALRAMEESRARLVRIDPAVATSQHLPSLENGVVDYAMTCHSGGAMEIFIEPVAPKPHIVIVGCSPIAQALARLGSAVDYSVSVAAPGSKQEAFPSAARWRIDLDLDSFGIAPQTYIVVSTQGEEDEEALERALRTNALYVAFVASKTKAKKVFGFLEGKGVARERLHQVRVPAGLDLGAVAPEEIAVGILAEIVQVKAAGTRRGANVQSSLPVLNNQPQPSGSASERDPICGMLVEKKGARQTSEYAGSTFYFCCAGCKQTFDRQPEKYAVAISMG